MRVDFLGEERTRLLKNYALISLVAITIDLIVFYILTNIVNLTYLLAVIFSFSLGKSAVYVLNKKYTFKDKNKVMEQIGSFLVVMFIGLITTQFLLLIFVEFVFLDEFLARTIVLPIVGIFHFWAHKNITFKKRGDSFYLNKYKDLILNSIGFLFLLIGTVAYYNAFVQNNFELVFWMCYLNLIILGVGVLSKNDKIIVAMLNIVSIPLIIWSFDFIVLLIGRTSPFGITGYFLTPGPIISKLVTMQHLITVPLAFYSLYLIKIRKSRAWIFSFGLMIFMFIVTRMFTTPEKNINCVYSSCMDFSLRGFHILNWFASVLLLILITNFIIWRLKFLRED